MVPSGLQEMAPVALAMLLLLLLPQPLSGPLARADACPAACRCYSTTVECGALRLRGVPPGIPAGTQVGTSGQKGGGMRGLVCRPPAEE